MTLDTGNQLVKVKIVEISVSCCNCVATGGCLTRRPLWSLCSLSFVTGQLLFYQHCVFASKMKLILIVMSLFNNVNDLWETLAYANCEKEFVMSISNKP